MFHVKNIHRRIERRHFIHWHFPLHGNPAAFGGKQLFGRTQELAQGSKRSRRNDVERCSTQLFNPAMSTVQVGKMKFGCDLTHKCGFLADRVDAGDVEQGQHDGKHDPWQTASAADVDHSCAWRLSIVCQRLDDRQAVRQMLKQHGGWITNCRQVVGAVPSLQQGKIVEQASDLHIRDRQPQRTADRAQLEFEAFHFRGSPPRTVASAPSSDAPAAARSQRG